MTLMDKRDIDLKKAVSLVLNKNKEEFDELLEADESTDEDETEDEDDTEESDENWKKATWQKYEKTILYNFVLKFKFIAFEICMYEYP